MRRDVTINLKVLENLTTWASDHTETEPHDLYELIIDLGKGAVYLYHTETGIVQSERSLPFF